MYEITEETIKKAHKPFDVVTDANGNVGYIDEVSFNESQPEPYQVSYSVEWLVSKETKCAWFEHKELTVHCNLLVKIAENACHPIALLNGNTQLIKFLENQKEDECQQSDSN